MTYVRFNAEGGQRARKMLKERLAIAATTVITAAAAVVAPAAAAAPPAVPAAPAASPASPTPPAAAPKGSGRPAATAPVEPPPLSGHHGAVLISEVMYNPASDESRGEPEWVEVVNVSGAAIEIAGWRLDDEDHLPFDEWGPFSCTLASGGVAVLVNKAFVDEAQFRAAWDATDVDVPPAYLVLPVKWGGLSNNPGPGNEVLRLLDDQGALVCQVDLRGGEGWPKLTAAGGPSVYLLENTRDLADGRFWKASTAGFDGARECHPTVVFNGRDLGSPGTVPIALLGRGAATTPPGAVPAGTAAGGTDAPTSTQAPTKEGPAGSTTR